MHMKCEISEEILNLTKNKQYKKAYVLYMKNKKEISFIDKITLRQILEPYINPNSYLALNNIIIMCIMLLILNILIDPWFHIEILDFVSYKAKDFVYCNYLLIFIPTLVNLILIIFILQNVVIYIKFHNNLTLKAIKNNVSILFIFTFLLVITFKNLVPNIMDLPLVLQNKYNVRIITEDYDINESVNNIIKNLTGRTDDDLPAPWYRSEIKKIRFRTSTYNKRIYYIHINDTDECRLSELKYENIANFNGTQYPFKIKYLPHSKIILQITN